MVALETIVSLCWKRNGQASKNQAPIIRRDETVKSTSALGFVLAAGMAFSGSALAQQTIKIGSVLSVTGPASFLGEPEDKTLRMYVDKINAAGGVNGKKIELVVYDDGGDANKARTFATRLIEDDKVVAMAGGSTTGTTMAMIPVFEEAQIPFISFGGAVEIIDPVRKYTFKTPHTDKMACEKIFENLKQRKLTNIAMISGTDGFGASMKAQCTKVAPNYDIKIITEESYGPRDSDMTGQLTKIKNTPGVQAIVNPDWAGACDRYPQLCPARHDCDAALSEPWCGLEELHRTRRPCCGRYPSSGGSVAGR
jgi:branched-chain amino acid transport system substrate-binding protein